VPVLPLLAVAACLFLMVNLQWITWLAFLVWLAIGLVVYFGYSRNNSLLARAAGTEPAGAVAPR
jgi:APA family basic amino acid/polyamine antiporter